MTELKTLKDLDLNYEDIWDWKKGTPEDILKKEAIKWVKDFREELERAKTEAGEFSRGWVAGFEQGIEDFEDFFNITEEDLK